MGVDRELGDGRRPVTAMAAVAVSEHAVAVGGRPGGHGRLPFPAQPGRAAGRLAAYRPGVRDHLVTASVPGDPARGQHVVRQLTGEEPGRARVVAGPVPGHAEQGGPARSSRSR